MLRLESAEVGGGSMKVPSPTPPPSRGTLTLVSGIEFRMYGWDAISNVRNLSFFSGSQMHVQSGCSDNILADPQGWLLRG